MNLVVGVHARGRPMAPLRHIDPEGCRRLEGGGASIGIMPPLAPRREWRHYSSLVRGASPP